MQAFAWHILAAIRTIQKAKVASALSPANATTASANATSAAAAGSVFFVGGATTAFDMSAITLLLGGLIVLILWREHYGQGDNDGTQLRLHDSVHGNTN